MVGVRRLVRAGFWEVEEGAGEVRIKWGLKT